MKNSYTISLVLVMAAAMLLATALPCWAVGKEKEDIWLEDKPEDTALLERWELTEEKIEHIMSYLAETKPAKAEELKQLREKELEKFKAELRKVMHEKFGKKLKEHGKQKAGQKSCLDRDMGRFGPRRGEAGEWRRREMVMGRRDARRGEYGERRTREMVRERLQSRHAEYIEWLGKNYPEKAEKLAELREEKPELYMKKLWLSKKQYGRIAEAAKENPQLAEVLKENLGLKRKRDELLRKIGAASEDEKKELVKELEKVVSSRFDLIVKRKQIRYEQLRKELEKLKEQVKKSEAEVGKWKEAKGEKVRERVEELISRTEKFKWD